MYLYTNINVHRRQVKLYLLGIIITSLSNYQYFFARPSTLTLSYSFPNFSMVCLTFLKASLAFKRSMFIDCNNYLLIRIQSRSHK